MTRTINSIDASAVDFVLDVDGCTTTDDFGCSEFDFTSGESAVIEFKANVKKPFTSEDIINVDALLRIGK